MQRTFRALILSSTFLFAIAASADDTARVNLPFSFVVKGHSFPAGYYDIGMDSTQSFVSLSSVTAPQDRAMMILRPADAAKGPAILSFDVCGGDHFLHDIHMGVRITGDLNKRGSEACADHTALSATTAGAHPFAGR